MLHRRSLQLLADAIHLFNVSEGSADKQQGESPHSASVSRSSLCVYVCALTCIVPPLPRALPSLHIHQLVPVEPLPS